MEDRGLAAKHSPEKKDPMKLSIALLAIIGLSVSSIQQFQKKKAEEYQKEQMATQGALDNLDAQRRQKLKQLEGKTANDHDYELLTHQLNNIQEHIDRQRAELGLPPAWN